MCLPSTLSAGYKPAPPTEQASGSEAGVLALFSGRNAAAEAVLDSYVNRIIQRFLSTDAVNNMPPDAARLAASFSDFAVPEKPVAAYVEEKLKSRMRPTIAKTAAVHPWTRAD